LSVRFVSADFFKEGLTLREGSIRQIGASGLSVVLVGNLLLSSKIADERKNNPALFYVDPANPQEILNYLISIGRLSKQADKLKLSKAGDGNMNLTLRVEAEGQSFILKQARPWVEKYPQIAAPASRLEVEFAFYQSCSMDGVLQKHTPGVLFFDPENRIELLEDLGEGEDLGALYRGGVLSSDELSQLAEILSHIHSLKLSSQQRKVFQNQRMKDLNHFHIFVFPFDLGNGFNLDEITLGLSDDLLRFTSLPARMEKISRLADLYLESGDSLLHGDFYPGSFLKRERVFLIDPEFAHVGMREFDLGVFIAHLHLSSQKDGLIEDFLNAYRNSGGDSFDRPLLEAMAGIEISRRLLGVAQLPIHLNREDKRKLLLKSSSYIDAWS